MCPRQSRPRQSILVTPSMKFYVEGLFHMADLGGGWGQFWPKLASRPVICMTSYASVHPFPWLCDAIYELLKKSNLIQIWLEVRGVLSQSRYPIRSLCHLIV